MDLRVKIHARLIQLQLRHGRVLLGALLLLGGFHLLDLLLRRQHAVGVEFERTGKLAHHAHLIAQWQAHGLGGLHELLQAL